MARFYGMIGFAIQKETRPGVWRDEIVERPYYGDVLNNIRKLQTSEGVNDDINVSNRVEIVADPFANENFHAMRYATIMGTKWKVTSVEVKYPRLVLSIGGIYNGGQKTETP